MRHQQAVAIMFNTPGLALQAAIDDIKTQPLRDFLDNPPIAFVDLLVAPTVEPNMTDHQFARRVDRKQWAGIEAPKC